LPIQIVASRLWIKAHMYLGTCICILLNINKLCVPSFYLFCVLSTLARLYYFSLREILWDVLAKQQILSVCWLDESVLRVSLPALKHGLAKILNLSMPAEGIMRP